MSKSTGRRSPAAPGSTVLLVVFAVAGCTVAPPPSASPGATASAETTPAATTAGSSAPGGSPSASPDTTPTPSPAATAQVYIVQSGDSLSSIADRFGVSVSQILAANPDIDDADDIRAGDSLVIPTPDAPTGLPRVDGISDPRGDLLDLDDQPAFATGAVDLTGFGARVGDATLFVELLVVAPPPPASPDVEQITYTVNIDTTGDGEPDFRLVASNTLEPDRDYAAALIDLATGVGSPPGDFPGTFEIEGAALRFEIPRATLGDPRRYALAATAERRFYPGGVGDPEVEAAVDRAPDQQWPRVNARWLEVGR